MSERNLAVSIVKGLQDFGYIAYFCGGCVRDGLLGVSPKDYDIVTNCPAHILKNYYHTFDANNEKFGIVCILLEGYKFEVANFRSDGIYKDGRRPENVSEATPEEDAQRRDFTINGIFYDPIRQKYHDHVDGIWDIQHRILRCIGNPAERFEEDHLRILRMVRFAAKYCLNIDPYTRKAAASMSFLLNKISRERIREELVRILNDSNYGLDLLYENNMLTFTLPELLSLKGCCQPPDHHPEGDVWVHTRKMFMNRKTGMTPLFAFAILLHDIGKPSTQDFEDGRIKFIGHEEKGEEMTKEILRRLTFSNDDIEYVSWLVGNHMKMMHFFEMKKSKRLRLMRHEWFTDLVELHRLDCIASNHEDESEKMLKQLEEIPEERIRPESLITGKDLIELGFTPGPIFKKIIMDVEDLQLEEVILNKEDALKYVYENYS